jgi:poly(3-hydroxybutyrate) depolymerase
LGDWNPFLKGGSALSDREGLHIHLPRENADINSRAKKEAALADLPIGVWLRFWWLLRRALEASEQKSSPIVDLAIETATADWDNFETSWDFRDLPLPRPELKAASLEAGWSHWEAYCTAAIRRMQELETENNRLFIEADGLTGELTPEVPEDQITLARADRRKDSVAFLSCAVSCIMGGYSLDHPGLILANAGDTLEEYWKKVGQASCLPASPQAGETPAPLSKFAPDEDGILPVPEGEWFEHDIVSRTRDFLRATFGEATLAENLRFIEEALGKDLRKYFLTDFYKDHLSNERACGCKKRPIYWLFPSGKKGFSTLVYLHRATSSLTRLSPFFSGKGTGGGTRTHTGLPWVTPEDGPPIWAEYSPRLARHFDKPSCISKQQPSTPMRHFFRPLAMLAASAASVFAQQAPYDVFPAAEVPYYRVRYDASNQPGALIYPVNYTIWLPPGVKTIRGVIVHQHGCGEGSCKSGLTGAFDLHWQALAAKHDCALMAPAYEQPDKADCQMWCDPRNGSSAAFQKALADLGKASGHAELSTVPWALWGHSGGGHWAGGMVLLHPERVAAAWLRSGVPLLTEDPKRATIKPHTVPEAALRVPIMCNPGTKEGVTVKEGRFAGVWPANEAFFTEVRAKGGLIGVAVDPLTSHECGNQRYMAILWLDECLRLRLPKQNGEPLQSIPTQTAWLAPLLGSQAVAAREFSGDTQKSVWLPGERIAKVWMQYVKDTAIADQTPPPAPTNLQVNGNQLTWEATADLESGLAHFIIERDGKQLAVFPEGLKNSFGRPIFQGLQYSDTPVQPLQKMAFTDASAEPGKQHTYRVIAVNTAGLRSP